MRNKQTYEEKKNQAENLKNILRGFGINTAEELDKALSDALDAMTIGIMTEQPSKAEDIA